MIQSELQTDTISENKDFMFSEVYTGPAAILNSFMCNISFTKAP